jgi:hypothetical protein
MNKKTFTFKTLIEWAKELNDAIYIYKNQYGVFPNIMLASETTYKRIDLIANTKAENINGDGSNNMPIIPENFVSLSGFASNEYNVDMCIADDLSLFEFVLIYDNDPDGEEIPSLDDEAAVHKKAG